MKILGNVSNVYKTYKSENASKTDSNKDLGVKDAGKKDQVSISNKAKIKSNTNPAEVDFLKQKLTNSEITKNERLSELKARIASGEYDVELEKVAESILNSNV